MADERGARAAAGSGTGRIYGIDPFAPPGSPARSLGVAKQAVHAVLRDGIAETEVDQTFSNPSGQAIEGWYWFTVPADAVVTSFALETNGQLVEGEVVEKREAAAQYAAAVRQQYDPALLEWVDGRSYRARIFPIPASGTRRVVLRYTQLLPTVEGKVRYVYPLRSDDPVRFDEFALSVDVGDDGPTSRVATSLDATIEPGGKLVTMRRSGYVPQADFQLEMTPPKQAPLRAWRFAAGTDQADYVMLRYAPEIDFASLPPQKGGDRRRRRHVGGRRRDGAAAPRGRGGGHPPRALGRGPLRARRARRRADGPLPREGARPGDATRASRRRSSGSASTEAAARPTSARCSSPRSSASTAASSPRSSTSATARRPRARRAPTA